MKTVMPDNYTLRPTNLGSTKDDFVFRFNGREMQTGRHIRCGVTASPRRAQRK